MLKTLSDNNRLNETLLLGIMTLICFAFSIFRVVYTGSASFLFLNWNLFLAFVPWALTCLVLLRPKIQSKKRTIIVTLFTWLVFFPNAPYILTDLFHLSSRSGMPIWFDLILILSFAWTGLLFGFLSLWDIETLLLKSLNRKWVTIISVVLLFMASFGIYVGRYLRWNSWDIVRKPYGLLQDIGERVWSPFDHPRTWGMTLFMGLFLTAMYWSFKLIRKRN